MRIKWLGHASFLIQGQGIKILTDPYEPGRMNLPAIDEKVDLVIRSSDDDPAHCYLGMLPSSFQVITATEYVKAGVTVQGIYIKAIPAQESLIHKESVGDNALYCFELEGINICHMGDVGNPLTESQIDSLKGTDVLLALAGGPPTIELIDLHHLIDIIQPKVVIPMHYRIPGPEFNMLPVDDFLDHYPDELIQWASSHTIEITKPTLPGEMKIMVLDPALVGN